MTLRLAGGDADVGDRQLRLWRRDTAADVELDRAEGLFVTLDRHADGRQEPLGRVSVHDDPLARLDVLAAGREGLGIEPEVEDDFLGGGGYPAEVGVRRQGPRVVDDNFRRLLDRGILL